jgi:hypothetical protein
MSSTLMHVLRIVRGSDSLDSLGQKLGYEKSTLSTVFRYPNQAGKRLRRSLERHFGCAFELLALSVDGEAIADAILKNYSSKG